MPKIPSKKSQAPAPAAAVTPAELPKVELRCVGSPKGPITAAMARKTLGWENELEFQRRRSLENPSADPSSFKFITEADIEKGNTKSKVAHNVLLKDINGVKVWCRNNDRNRPFDEQWARRNAQEILLKNWAGPAAWPGETVNGDTIKITVSNTVIDAQHRLIGLILAFEEWSHPERGRKWKTADYWPEDKWPDGPVLEGIVVTGISDSWRVAQTCDNTRPRTLSDTIYTSEIFSKLPPRKRDKASRVLSDAIEFLWKRLDRGGKGENKVYKTHVGHHQWLAHHMRLVKCVEHIYQENEEDPREERGNRIERFETPIPGEISQKLGDDAHGSCYSGLKPGVCAGMMFLMGSSDSDPGEYRKHLNPTQRLLDWKQWDKAGEFWTCVGSGTGPEWNALRAALLAINLRDTQLSNGEEVDGESTSTTSQIVERNVVLSKAWHLFKTGEKITKKKVMPDYNEVTGPDGKTLVRLLVDRSNFGGIDLGDKLKDPGKGVKAGKTSIEDVKKKAGEAKSKRTHGEKPSALLETVARKMKRYEGKVMLNQNPNNKRYFCYQEHADLLTGMNLEGVMVMDDYDIMGVRAVSMSSDLVDNVITKLNAAGHTVAKVREGKDGDDVVSYHTPGKKK